MKLWVKSNIKNIVLVGMVLTLIIVLTKCSSTGKNITNTIIKAPSEKTINRNIYNEKQVIRTYEKEVLNKKELSTLFESMRNDLMDSLHKTRERQDWNSVIRIQDSVIHIQGREIANLHGIIDLKDSIILAERYISNSKDTLLAIRDVDVKKFKRQRNWLALACVVEAGIIIIK